MHLQDNSVLEDYGTYKKIFVPPLSAEERRLRMGRIWDSRWMRGERTVRTVMEQGGVNEDQ